MFKLYITISPVLFYTVYEQCLAHACPQGSQCIIYLVTIEIFMMLPFLFTLL